MGQKQKQHITHARTATYNANYHIVWCVKYRRRVLEGDVAVTLKNLFCEIASDKDFTIRQMEVMPDHVHVFVTAHPKYSPSYIYKMLKGISARRLFVLFPELKHKLWKGHLWSPSTYTETIGHVSEATVVKYIEDQKSK